MTNSYISQLVIPLENQELIPMQMIGDGLMDALEADRAFNGVSMVRAGASTCGTKFGAINTCSLKPLRTVCHADCLFIQASRYKFCFRCMWDKAELHIAELLRHAKTSPNPGGSNHWTSMDHAKNCATPLFDSLRKIQPAQPLKTDTPYLPGYYDEITITSSVCSLSKLPILKQPTN